MKVTMAQAYIPARTSLAVNIGQDPSIDLVAGHDLNVPPGSTRLSGPMTPSGGETFLRISNGPALAVARDKVIGQRLAFANAGFTMIDKGLPLTGVSLPAGTDTVLEIVGVAISGADTYHAFTRDDASIWNQALSVANTMSSLTELLSPLIPTLKPYEPALQGVGLILKVIKSGNELMKAEGEYRVVQMKVSP